MSTVVRDNKEVSIRSSQLVPGDIVIVIEGDRVSADSLLIENHNITMNEAALTGEYRLYKVPSTLRDALEYRLKREGLLRMRS